jgi:DNA polymerase-1
MTAKHVLLIDGNSIAHANHNATALTVGDFQTQAIFGFLKSLRLLMSSTIGHKEPIVLWDGKAQWRIDMHPGYKGNRAPLDAKQEAHRAAFKRQTPFIEKAVSMLGVRQVRSPLLEADDLAGFYTRLMTSKGMKVTLVSGDRDWLSLVDENVSWFDPIRDRKVTHENFLEFTGYFTTGAFVQGKALQGDNSDNIDGIAGMGEKGAALFLAQWKDVNEFFRQVDAGTYTPKKRASKTATSLHPEQILASPEGRAKFERNIKLMDLRLSRTPEPGEVIATKPTPNPEAFLHLCERLAFMSILRERHAFLREFGLAAPAIAAV